MKDSTLQPEQSHSTRAVGALLRLREAEDRKSRESLLRKQREVSELQSEIDSLRERRDALLRRGGRDVLQERLLLDTILKLTLEHGRELETLKAEAGALLEVYRETNRSKKVVSALQAKRSVETEAQANRRSEVADCDLDASRRTARSVRNSE